MTAMSQTETAESGGREPERAILWCMCVRGPDEVHAAPDFWTAHAWATELNVVIAERAKAENWSADDNFPLTSASVEPWPWSAEDHAIDLAKQLAERAAHEARRAAASAAAAPSDKPSDAHTPPDDPASRHAPSDQGRGGHPIATTAKNTPILAWCDHEADPWSQDGGTRLTLYAAHAEGLSHAPTGFHIIEWGGGFDDRSYEEPNGGHLLDWWFVAGSEFEIATNPVKWWPLPRASATGEAGTPGPEDAVTAAMAALEEAAAWHERQERALSKQPQNADLRWRRGEHRDQADEIREALARLRTPRESAERVGIPDGFVPAALR